MASTVIPVRTSIASASNACINQPTKSRSKRGSSRSFHCDVGARPRSDMGELRRDVAAPTNTMRRGNRCIVPHEVFFARNPQFDRLCSGGDQKMTCLQGFVFDLQ